MNLRILGSAAAEAVPALWCECEYCRYAMAQGGRDWRCRTAYLLDSDTLVDFGPDAHLQVRNFGIDLTRIERIFYTHAHSDHCDPVELYWRRPGFSKVSRELALYGSRPVFDKITHFLHYDENVAVGKLQVAIRELSAGVEVTAGDLTVLPVAANHAPELLPLNYFLSRGGKTVLIANDTGFWLEKSWQTAAGMQADCAIIDGTMGLVYADHRDGHMGARVVVEFRDELIRRGALKPQGRAIVNHFSHNGDCRHAKLEEFFAPHGIDVGFDGMNIEV